MAGFTVHIPASRPDYLVGLDLGQTQNFSALAVLANGDLVAGGQFTTAGGVTANNIARWDGTSWSALGSAMNFNVLTLTTIPILTHSGWTSPTSALLRPGSFSAKSREWARPGSTAS